MLKKDGCWFIQSSPDPTKTKIAFDLLEELIALYSRV